MYFDLTRLDAPAGYRLETKDEGRTLVLMMRAELLEALKPHLNKEHPWIAALLTGNSPSGLDVFLGTDSPKFGFNGVFRSTDCDETDWLAWECPLTPIVVRDSKKNNWRFPNSVSATLNVLTSFVGGIRDEDVAIKSPEQQLFHINGMRSGSQALQGGAIGFAVSPLALGWLKNIDAQERGRVFSFVHRCMSNTVQSIWPAYGSLDFDHPFSFYEGWWPTFSFTGASLAVMGMERDRFERGHSGPGAEMDCHNIDSTIQQLVIVMGVAALWQWIYEHPLT